MIRDLIERFTKRKNPDSFKQRELGLEAKRFLEDKVFGRALDNVRMGLIQKWASSPIDDHEGQHELRLMLKLLDDLVGNIEQELNSGKFAAKQIEEQEAKDKRAKEVIQFRR